MLPSFPTPGFTYTLNIDEVWQTLCSVVTHIFSCFIYVVNFFVKSQVNCCSFALTNAIAFTTVIISAIHTLKEQTHMFVLSFSPSIGFLAVEALLKPHITNCVNLLKALRHNLSIHKKSAYKKTDSPPVKHTKTLPKQKDLLHQRKTIVSSSYILLLRLSIATDQPILKMPAWKVHKRLEYFLLLIGVLKRNGFLFPPTSTWKLSVLKQRGQKIPNTHRKENLLSTFKKHK